MSYNNIDGNCRIDVMKPDREKFPTITVTNIFVVQIVLNYSDCTNTTPKIMSYTLRYYNQCNIHILLLGLVMLMQNKNEHIPEQNIF